jgi:hypothetical protein
MGPSDAHLASVAAAAAGYPVSTVPPRDFRIQLLRAFGVNINRLARREDYILETMSGSEAIFPDTR